jgi:hypothetical protein
MKYANHQQGFLVLEILIAGLILTASIAATMYLFRMGYDYLEKANRSNVLSSKLVQAAGLLKTLEMEKKSGVEDMGDDVNLKWAARLLGSSRPTKGGGEFAVTSIHELFLYRVDFSLVYQNTSRDYQINVFRYKPLYFPGTAAP